MRIGKWSALKILHKGQAEYSEFCSANLRHPEPTRLASASVGVIHDVIKHQKESLKL
jgi:hypothetical protein